MNPLRGLAVTCLMLALRCGGDGGGGADASVASGQSGASGSGGVGGANAGSGGSGAIGGMSSGGMTAVGSGGTSNSGGASGVGSGGTGGTSVGEGGAQADRFARAAAVIGSCVPDDGINRNLSYMWYPTSTVRFWGHYGSQAECLATHGGGCAAAVACVGWEIALTTEPCASGCDGDTFTFCEAEGRLSVDCSKLGLQCDPVAFCSDSPATTCDSETFVNSCDTDSIPLICDDDATHTGPDCPAFGLGCTDGSCVGLGAACTGGSHSYQGDIYYDGLRCDGSALIACVDGREHRLDCPSVAEGFSCQTHEGESFCGIASECTPAAPAEGWGPDEACEGDEVVFCNAGRVQRVDCVALGFEGCDVEAGQGCVPGPAQQ